MSTIYDGNVVDAEFTAVQDNIELTVLGRIDKINVGSHLAVFDPIKAATQALAFIIASTPYDINTGAGEAVARDLRSRCVKLRTSTANLYKERNTPLLELQNAMRKMVAEINAAVAPHEAVLDAAIQKKEHAKEAIRLQKLAIEEARIRALRAQITAVAGMPAQAALLDSEGIRALLCRLGLLDRNSFAEFAAEFDELHTQTHLQLTRMHGAAEERQAQAELNRLESLRLEEERTELARQARESKEELQALADAAHIQELQRMEAARAQYQLDEAAADRRQREAEAASARASQQLRNQHDAFEAERQSAMAELAAERAAVEALKLANHQAVEASQAAAKAQADAQTSAAQSAVILAASLTLEVPGCDVVELFAQPRDASAQPASPPSSLAMAYAVAGHFDVTVAQAITWLEGFNSQSANADLALPDQEVCI